MAQRRKVDIVIVLWEVCAGSLVGEFNIAPDCGAAKIAAAREMRNYCKAVARCQY